MSVDTVKLKKKKPDYMGKPQFYPAVFDIDISVCMSCQICVEVCLFEAIKMDKVFELTQRERFDALLIGKNELLTQNFEMKLRIKPAIAISLASLVFPLSLRADPQSEAERLQNLEKAVRQLQERNAELE